LAALLRAQPMGFYSPATLVADARRHGVTVLRPDVQLSGAQAGLERDDGRVNGEGSGGATGRDSCLDRMQPIVEEFDPDVPDDTAAHRRDGRFAVRLGLASVKGIGDALAGRIVQEREDGGAYRDMRDLVRRVGLSTAQLESLASVGAFDGFGISRREALWAAGSAAQDRAEYLPGT